ncbi:winged helix-turn-helix domain-containing protein [Pandoraea sputorum]|uniref:winged helix-turn-helix domain-containing protein n=1 Tax=Pandoraea sputorum TaxID=93222 RepID=UPI001E387AB0|nr:winged helix-turn-helix domain-containing protein [Pandoraea sputorum]MCE4061815.1 winged helix-turn-helix domain-containing protein [Pandoraea sputorum]
MSVTPDTGTSDVEPAASVRDRSTVDFPYVDIDNATEIVRGVHATGGTACDYDQLAAHLGLEAKGGGFRIRVNGARTYGLITYERGGRITLTDLGRQIIDSSHERAARVDAFLNVELFQKVFDRFKGSPLPPQAGFENSLVDLGVGAKVKDRARQVLLRSAKQAGFFDLSSERLSRPPVRQDHPPKPEEHHKEEHSSKDSGKASKDGSLHPLIQGLLMTLPSPGDTWSAKERSNWLTMANSIFKMIYVTSSDDDEVSIATRKADS